MRRLAIRPFAGALAVAALLAFQPVHAVEVPQYTIEDFLATTNMSGTAISPDGSKILVSSDQTGVFNAYAVPVGGGKPVQLTSADDDFAIMVRTWFPKDERFLYLRAIRVATSGRTSSCRIADGKVTDLTPGENLKAEFVGWADDDKSFFVQHQRARQAFFDFYESRSDGYERTLIYQDDAGYQFGDDLARQALDRVRQDRTPTTTPTCICTIGKTKDIKHLTPHEGDVSYDVETFSPDGKSLYLTTDERAEFRYLVQQDLATGTRTVVEKPDWDVSGASFSQERQVHGGHGES